MTTGATESKLMSENTQEEIRDAKPAPESNQATGDPVRRWTLIVLAICVVLLFWYLRSDRVTPFTSQARVHALVVPIAPEVSGTITSVEVSNNQAVAAGDVLFRIDEQNYGYALQTAQAALDLDLHEAPRHPPVVSARLDGLDGSGAPVLR